MYVSFLFGIHWCACRVSVVKAINKHDGTYGNFHKIVVHITDPQMSKSLLVGLPKGALKTTLMESFIRAVSRTTYVSM